MQGKSGNPLFYFCAAHIILRNSVKIKYHEFKNNCYDFVIRFLNFIDFNGICNHNKQEVVDNIVKGPVDGFESFFKIHSKLTADGPFSIPIQRCVICDICGKKGLQADDLHHCLECDDFDLCSCCLSTIITDFSSGAISSGAILKGSHTPNHKLFSLYMHVILIFLFNFYLLLFTFLKRKTCYSYFCDGCNEIIVDEMWRCVHCDNTFDLCRSCHEGKVVKKKHSNVHKMGHVFM